MVLARGIIGDIVGEGPVDVPGRTSNSNVGVVVVCVSPWKVTDQLTPDARPLSKK